jgi:hypothetical protein
VEWRKLQATTSRWSTSSMMTTRTSNRW